MSENKKQVPVMLEDVKRLFKNYVVNIASNDNNEQVYVVDLTLGDAGHSLMFLEQIDEYKSENFINGGKLLSVDWDKMAINYVLKQYKNRINTVFYCDIGCDSFTETEVYNKDSNWYVVLSNFVWIDKVVEQIQFPKIDFVLVDLGVSTRQLLSKNRGFSFNGSSSLDMRMSKDFLNVKAYDLLNGLSMHEIRDMYVATIGMPKSVASKVADLIVKERDNKPFGDNDDKKRLQKIANYLQKRRIWRFGDTKLNSLTLLLLGLRVAVNAEKRHIFDLWHSLSRIMKQKAEVIAIGFNSTEWEILESTPMLYGFNLVEVFSVNAVEAKKNPRSRSAKLFRFRYEGK